MVKNARSSSNLRGSTSTLSLSPAQTTQIGSAAQALADPLPPHEAITHGPVSTARLQDKNVPSSTPAVEAGKQTSQSTLFSNFGSNLKDKRSSGKKNPKYNVIQEGAHFPTSTSSNISIKQTCYMDDGNVASTSLFERFMEDPTKNLAKRRREKSARDPSPSDESLITRGLERQVEEQNVLKSPEAYTQPFCDFLTENPTVWHTVKYFEEKLDGAGFHKLSERHTWTSTLEKGGKYYVSRNGSALIAFTVGAKYEVGNGVAMIAGHVDALTARLKPISTKTTKAGYVQLGVAPYAGALNSTWWDRDLGIGGRVLVKDVARIPTLAPHFGVGMTGDNNAETEAVPIIGLDYSSPSFISSDFENLTLGGPGTFTATQPPKLVRAIAGELSIEDYSSIVNWELELYDTQPAQVGGLEKEFIFAGRIDDKLCSWSAIEGLIASSASSPEGDGIVKLVGVFDDEEIGSLLRQGARGNFLPSTIERITESMSSSSANILSQTYANSFLISADVTHAVNPNFLSRYLENHAPRLNVGLVVSADSNGHMTTDSVSTAILTRVAEKSKSELQLFMIRNDSRSGGTVGPMLSSAMGVRAVDAGIPQLSMHSIRATTGALDPGLGAKIFKGFFDSFESVDKEFE
ncbi:Leucine aminopeptidase IV [Hyphodiscus hymeniophilus]|uniref:Leucine aminopeptidase IV n=1 Tax=Hyphodiscus hymeniophilus TaxID=353542 RepID=A0A9P7AUK6_9HELO|nr:Leucine aminopeptidase IV [Hyphodiscus hymeniophilus]